MTRVSEHEWVKVAQSCPTLCDPMDYTDDGILQARILEWGAFPFSRGSSQPRDWTQVSHITGGFSTSWAAREAQVNIWPYYSSNNSCWLAHVCWLYYCNKCFPPAKSDKSNDFCNYYCPTCSLDKKSKTFIETVVITVTTQLAVSLPQFLFTLTTFITKFNRVYDLW